MRRTERGLWVPFPSSDLDSPALEQNAFPVDPQMQEVLSYSALLGPNGGKLARADKNGNLLVSVQSPPAITQVQLLDPLGNFAATPTNPINQRPAPPVLTNLIPSRTDTSNFTSGDFVTPGCSQLVIVLWVAASSGTSPSIKLELQTKTSIGTYVSAGGVTGTLSGAGAVGYDFSATANGVAAFVGPTFRLTATITGTLPSFTWGADQIIR